MREFLSGTNFVKAAALSLLVTLMSLARLVQGGMPLWFYIPLTFLVMMLVGGMVTAWGRSAGMPGIVTDRRTLLRGLALAAILSVLAFPVHRFWLDPVLHDALRGADDPAAAGLSFPSSGPARLALLLWSMGFQLMFLVACPMSLFTRLMGRRSIALALCMAVRAYVMYEQVVRTGVTEAIPLYLASALLTTAAQCLVFAAFGLFPTMLLAAGMTLPRLF